MKNSTRKIALIGLFLSLSIIGANIKMLGSIALDSFPGFIAAIIIGPGAGAIIGFFGHIVSALLAGFPNTLPIHLIIAMLMSFCLFVFGWIRHQPRFQNLSSRFLSFVIAYLINVPLDLIILYPFLGKVVFGLFVPLTAATLANLVIAEMVFLALPHKIKNISGIHF